MRRRVTALSALAAALLLTAVTAAPAVADDAPAPTGTAAADPSPTAAADPVDLALVDPLGSGNVVRGGPASAAWTVSGTSPGATLTLDVPDGLTVTGATLEQHDLTCAPTTGTVVCDLGAVDGLETLNVEFAVAGTVAIGAHRHVDATVAPVPGPDSDPSNNASAVDFVVVGHAVVTQTQSGKQINVRQGGSAQFAVALHNNGPDLATHGQVRFAIQSNDAVRPVISGSTFTAGAVVQGNGVMTWEAFSIPAGGTVSITLTISTTAPAVDSALSFSASYDGVGEICTNAACLSGAPIRTFVPGLSLPGGSPVTAPATGPELANTGSADSALALLAVGLLVAGGGLTAAGRRRRSV